MSLVDLPGMTRVPVKGQPDDIAAKLQTLIMKYINNPACIILAVSAANSDLANSDAIALARAADPYGTRTVGAPPSLQKLCTLLSRKQRCDRVGSRRRPLRHAHRRCAPISANLQRKDMITKHQYTSSEVQPISAKVLRSLVTQTAMRSRGRVLRAPTAHAPSVRPLLCDSFAHSCHANSDATALQTPTARAPSVRPHPCDSFASSGEAESDAIALAGAGEPYSSRTVRASSSL